MHLETEKVLLRISEVTKATGFSRSFIYDRISAGDLKVVRIGRTVRVRIEDMNEWIGQGSSCA